MFLSPCEFFEYWVRTVLRNDESFGRPLISYVLWTWFLAPREDLRTWFQLKSLDHHFYIYLCPGASNKPAIENVKNFSLSTEIREKILSDLNRKTSSRSFFFAFSSYLRYFFCAFFPYYIFFKTYLVVFLELFS